MILFIKCFKYCCLSKVDPKAPPSNTFKIKLGWLLVCDKSNLKNIVLGHNQLDMTSQLIGSGLSNYQSNPVRAKVKC